MKHWDLCPGEMVTLTSSSGATIRGAFEFRDTVHACFLVEDDEGDLHLRQFYLVDDGTLTSYRNGRQRNGGWKFAYTINGADRHTRYQMPDEPEHARGAAS